MLFFSFENACCPIRRRDIFLGKNRVFRSVYLIISDHSRMFSDKIYKQFTIY